MTYSKTKSKDFPAWPYADEIELRHLKEVLNSNGWWRTSGRKVKEFEKKFSHFQSSKYALCVSNGTRAIEIALKSLQIGNGDEVIVPAFTFMSPASAVLYCNATPIFCDVDPETFCMDPDSFEKAITRRTKAVIPVHMGGQMCDMEKIKSIADPNGIKIVEDAAHAQGAAWDGYKAGHYGDIATFSFQNQKIMTCGEGGAIITNNKELYERAYLLHSLGRPDGDDTYEHLLLASNDRMSEFQAAVLLGQLSRLDRFNKIREKNASYLNILLSDVKGITPQKFDNRATVNTHYMYMFYYDKTHFRNMDRNTFIKFMKEEGIPCHIAYPLVFNAPFFTDKLSVSSVSVDNNRYENNFPNAMRITQEVIWLPHNILLGDNLDLYEIRSAILKIQNKLAV